jgi:hypothetical protein
MASNAQSRSRRDHDLWDAKVNDLWNGQQPILSPAESLAAAQKLYRHAMGRTARKWRWELTSGRRYTWPRAGTFYVNPDRTGAWQNQGLRDIVHLMAHYCHGRLHPEDKPHSIRQLRLEAKLTKFALSRRWHEGTLKAAAKPLPKKPSRTEKVKRLQQLELRLKRRRAEFERAQRLLAKAAKDYREHRTANFRWLDR